MHVKCVRLNVLYSFICDDDGDDATRRRLFSNKFKTELSLPSDWTNYANALWERSMKRKTHIRCSKCIHSYTARVCMCLQVYAQRIRKRDKTNFVLLFCCRTYRKKILVSIELSEHTYTIHFDKIWNVSTPKLQVKITLTLWKAFSKLIMKYARSWSMHLIKLNIDLHCE